MSIGIYGIKNKINEFFYIGQSTNLEVRKRRHKIRLRNNYHENIFLQRSWNKYGAENFEFMTLEICNKENLNELEKKYIEKYNSLYPNGYNLRTGGDRNWTYSEETKRKIGDGNRGKIISEETRKKISNFWKIHGSPSKGIIVSKETREKISNSLKGKIPWNKGIPVSPEAKQKMRMAKLGIPQKREFVEIRAKKIQQSSKVGKFGFRGVGERSKLTKTKKRYSAEISYKNKKYSLGGFFTPEEAAKAYDMQALFFYGDDARLNFPELFDNYKLLNVHKFDEK